MLSCIVPRGRAGIYARVKLLKKSASAAAPCHLDRTTKDPKGTEAEWRDPVDVSPAMLMQGVLPKPPGLFSGPHETASATNSGFTFYGNLATGWPMLSPTVGEAWRVRLTIFSAHFTKFVSSNFASFSLHRFPKSVTQKKTGRARVDARTVPDHKSPLVRKAAYG